MHSVVFFGILMFHFSFFLVEVCLLFNQTMNSGDHEIYVPS